MDTEENGADSQAGYSIQWHTGDLAPCPVCGFKVGSGLVGFKAGAGAICDPCLLQAAPHLGRTLLLVNISRELAADFPENPWEQDVRQSVLMAAARLYDAQESRDWPYRAMNILELWKEHGKALADIPLDSWVRSLSGKLATREGQK